MKKVKKLLLILLIASISLLIGFKLWELLTLDSTPPVISCPDQVMDVSINITDKELLEGVSAYDDHDGDLSQHIVVETLSSMNSDLTREVVYAVMDMNNNVSRATRTVRYTDYEAPRILLIQPLRISKPDQLGKLLSSIQASSTLDGDLSNKLKCNFHNGTPIDSEGIYDVELRVSDSTGNSTIIPTVLEIYDGQSENIHVELNEYLLYLHVNDAFSPEDYFGAKKENEWVNEELRAQQLKDLSIESNVDTSVPGVYHATYTVAHEEAKTMGRSRLIVVVEE